MTTARLFGEPVYVIRWRTGNHVDPAFEREQRQYLADPSAFWNRPDGDYLTDEPYVPVTRFYDACRMMTAEVTYE